jgi:serine protease Do
MSFYDKVMRQKFLSATLIVFTLAIGIVIGSLAQTGAKAAKEQTVAPDATPLTVPSPVQMQSEFAKIAKMLEPTVVNISTEYIPQKKSGSQNRGGNNNRRRFQQQPQDDDDDDADQGGGQDFFQRFFGGGGGPFQQQEPEDQRSGSLGSGVVVDRNGYILTNNHVVEKATRIKVKFMNDDTEYPATVIGTDVDTDLAVIHVDRKNLPYAKIGNSDALQPGDWTVAIGSPFGFAATVTAGIVSAVARDIPGDATSFQHFIQTDAAINPGNSGGPLANINGEVIGINTMIASRSGGYQGIGFAMPINTAVKVYNEIIKAGHMTRGSIGIRFKEETGEKHQALLKVYGADHGIFVESVEPNGPADKAGMKPQDVVTAINGKDVKKGQDLIDLIADSPVESTIKMSIVRDKKPMTLSVVVGDRAKIFGAGADTSKKQSDGPADATEMKFGMSVQSLRQSDRQNMGFKGKGGVLVASIEPGSFADDIGMAKGDIIVELNRQEVSSPEDIRKIQGSLKAGDAVAFHVMRRAGGPRGGDWQDLFVAGTVPQQ